MPGYGAVGWYIVRHREVSVEKQDNGKITNVSEAVMFEIERQS